MAHQTPDDFLCPPAAFLEWCEDGAATKTFDVRSPWTVGGTRRIGELVVCESTEGPLVRITIEDEEDR